MSEEHVKQIDEVIECLGKQITKLKKIQIEISRESVRKKPKL